ncbi:hypothetical protein LY01_02188 [Nonlabens xylanidelens]|uniref:Uncharacterized protein n=1 Tax=Nonlabens xylanidelens TaxID=191564 RepID=A0A2S6IIF7_9FLAO|nr:hypothetical protein [Nonlabens xylanidelens]PPK93966.1 hypothetical protein LY01_02188 [Nonlabens xylanidelens]PQJ22122.1 hypothetical protein BST94_00660 [Nonlabens xylanidelens]
MIFKTFLSYLITLLLLIGLWGAGGLVLEELKTGNGCPKIALIPACIIIFFCFLIPALSHLTSKKTVFYYLFTALAFGIAAVASYLQFNDLAQCPKMANLTPMCYISLLIFSTLIILKYVEQKVSLQYK